MVIDSLNQNSLPVPKQTAVSEVGNRVYIDVAGLPIVIKSLQRALSASS